MKKFVLLLLLLATAVIPLTSCKDEEEVADPSTCLHKYVREESEEYLMLAPTCQTGTSYFSHCELCGAIGAVFTNDEKAEHSFVKIPEDENLVSAATCSQNGVYYSYCKVCGERGDTFELGERPSHVLIKSPSDLTLASEANCKTPEKHFYICGECGYVLAGGTTYDLGPKRDHKDSHGDEICDICQSPTTIYPDDPEIELGTGIHPFKEEN